MISAGNIPGSIHRSFQHDNHLFQELRQRVIDIFVNSIYLYDDKVVMYFNIKDASQVSYIEMQENLKDLEGSDLNGCGVPNTGLSEHIVFIFVNGIFGCVINRES